MMGGAAERHIEQFGVKQMHVPTVTSSAKRVQNMVEIRLRDYGREGQ